MKLEIINRFDKLIHTINCKENIPPKNHINSMLQNGYKFKLDGKILTKKKLEELIKGANI